MEPLKLFDSQRQFSVSAGLILLFLIAPFYIQHNVGGVGLYLTYNIPVWTVASWLIAFGILLIANTKQFTYPVLWSYLLLFPILIITISVFSDIVHPITWFFRQLYILGGLFFLFSLFQFQLKQSTIDKVLYVLVVAVGLHALLGKLQIFVPEYLPSWVPNRGGIPRGIFQQINVQVSFLVSGIVIAIYLISRPSFRFSSILTKTLFVLSFLLALYIVAASGSRIGLLSLLLSVPLITLCRFKQLRVHKKMLLILLVLSCCTLFLGQKGLDRTIDKTAQLSEKSYSTARVAMYTIGFELIAKEPIKGFGIGGFLKAWNGQATDFVLRHPETSLPQYVTHPHNELLFWMIEAGLLAVVGIITFIVGIGIAICRCGFQRGGAYVAMLIPITLHTQVELPFYISSVHWFLWLFLIYQVLKHQTKVRHINLSVAASSSLHVIAVIFAVVVTVFMLNTARAQADLYNYLYDKNVQPPYLQVAIKNLYTKPYAERLAMRSMLYSAIENNDRAKVEVFEQWAKDYVSKSPELKMYEDLITASVYLRPKGKGCDLIYEAYHQYAHNEALKKARLNCY